MSRIDHHRQQLPDDFGSFQKSYHLEMVSDRARTDAIFAGLRRALSSETVFCELGCGTGIFSIFAAETCRKVYAIEFDKRIIETARGNIMRSPNARKIQLIEGNAMEVALPERVDTIFCEMMSIWAIEEPQVYVVNRARLDLLKPNGKVIPSRIVNLAELGHYDFERGGIVMKAVTPLFTGIRKPALMTERRVCTVLDLSDQVSPDLSADIEYTAIASGTINCAVLSSVVQFGSEIAFSGSDSLMPQTVVPLSKEVPVRFGARVRFRAAVRAHSDMEESTFVADIV